MARGILKQFATQNISKLSAQVTHRNLQQTTNQWKPMIVIQIVWDKKDASSIMSNNTQRHPTVTIVTV